MFVRYIKKSLKHNQVVHYLVAWIIYIYLKIVYLTSKWEFIKIDSQSRNEALEHGNALYALWHNRIAFGMYIFRSLDGIHALVSSHTDGKIITDVIKLMGYQVIEGSSNRNPIGATKHIIKVLLAGGGVVITPDGPRGPVYKINSSITKIAYKTNKPIIPLSCMPTKYMRLKSWDQLVLPKPFGVIKVIIGEPITLSGNEKEDNELLEKRLRYLTSMVEETKENSPG